MAERLSAATLASDRAVQDVLPTVLDELARHVEALTGTAQHTWHIRHFLPRSARETSRRLFVEVAIDGVPTLIAKVPLNDADAMVDHEWEVLRHIAPRSAAFDVPRAVARLQRGFLMLWAPSVDLPDLLGRHPSEDPALMESAALAVAKLHGTPRTSQGSAAEIVRDYLGTRFELLPGPTVEALGAANVGTFHGDLGPWNVRLGPQDRMALVDWEDYREYGVQAVDALNLLMTWVLAADPGYRDRSGLSLVSEMLDPSRPVGRGIVRGLRKYADATGQDIGMVGDLVPVFCLWMDERIRRQGRATSHLFYGPLLDHFADRRPSWMRELIRWM